MAKHHTDSRDAVEDKRMAAVAPPSKEAVVARATSLAKESKPREHHSESDSSSESDASSDTNFQRERSPMSLSECYSPEHYWSDNGRETLSEARARGKREK